MAVAGLSFVLQHRRVVVSSNFAHSTRQATHVWTEPHAQPDNRALLELGRTPTTSVQAQLHLSRVFAHTRALQHRCHSCTQFSRGRRTCLSLPITTHGVCVSSSSCWCGKTPAEISTKPVFGIFYSGIGCHTNAIIRLSNGESLSFS